MIKKLLTIGFICSATLSFSQSGLANLSFENFTSIILLGPTPVGFVSTGTQSITTGAQHLNTFARITSNGMSASNILTGTGAMVLGGATGTVIADGAPYTTKPTAFSGYYKATILTNDSAFIFFDLTNNGSSIITNTVVKGLFITANETSWKAFSIPITYTGSLNPDSAFVVAAANKNYAGASHPAHGTPGTVLDVDNFEFVTSTNIQKFEDYAVLLTAYPNPAADNFNIVSKTKDAAKIEVYDLSGRLVEQKLFEADEISINVNHYAPGVYIYKVFDKTGRALKSEKFTVTN